MDYAGIFTDEVLEELLPAGRSDEFFEALYGDAEDGAYDIRLAFVGDDNGALRFEFRLHQRPGKCLACNLTYGLPQVFGRHPLLNVKGIVARIDELTGKTSGASAFTLGATYEISHNLHAIPMTVA